MARPKFSDSQYTRDQECVCPVCNKTFTRGANWVYRTEHKGKNLSFCRYNCMRTFEREVKPQKLKGENYYGR